MIVEAAELQTFKRDANTYLLDVDGLWFALCPSVFFIYFCILLTFRFNFIKLFAVVVWFYCCFLFFLKFSLTLLGCLPCRGLWVFGVWLSQFGIAVWNVMIRMIKIKT